MQIQQQHNISRKSKGILYTFKDKLKKNNLTILQLVNQIFKFQKEKFNRNDFCKLIKSMDNKLTYEQIDKLMNDLDQNKNNFVFLQELIVELSNIGEQDDPFNSRLDLQSSQIKQRSKIRQITQQQEILLVLKQIKDSLKNTDPYQYLDMMDSDKDGALNFVEMQELLLNLGINDAKHITLVINHVLHDKSRISFRQLMTILGLQMTKRVDINQLSSIKPKQQKRQLQPLPSFKKKQSEESYIFLSIPSQIEPYYNHSCQLEEPLKSMALMHLMENTIFIDYENPNSSKAVKWEHINIILKGKYFLFQQRQSLIKDKKGQLGKKIHAKNIIQGSQGDCYFLSAVAGVAEIYPELIFSLFVLEKNPVAIFGVRLFIDGAWDTIVTDARFPVNQYNQLIYAKPQHHEIWVLLLQKAWAKVFKSYENINAGFTAEGLTAVTGAPCFDFSTSEEGALKKIQLSFEKGYLINCSSSIILGQMTEKQQQNLGIFASHAYTILSVQSKIVNQKKITLVKVRNPWGNKAWKGDWSYESNKWTSQHRKVFNYYKNPNDGSFYMSIEDLMFYFQRLTICKISLGKQHSSVKITSHRNHSTMFRFKVKTSGDYFFSLYQQNKRKYNNSTIYELSKSRIYLGMIKNGEIQAISSQTALNQNLHLQTTLQPGQYILSSKIKWKYHQIHSYYLTSYGPDKIKFQQTPKDKQFLIKFIESKASLELGKKEYFLKYSHVGLASSYKMLYMDYQEGFGYLLVRNNSYQLMNCKYIMKKMKGLKLIKPDFFPIEMFVMPNTTVIKPLIVDPEGFSYQYFQQIRLEYL